jgi:cation:H+ antiporter
MLMNILIFVMAACVVWYAGTKLERQSDAIAIRTGLGHALIGMLLLAGATSLPEIATTFTAVWIGNISMATHNLLGSVVFNTAALAIADIASGDWALTHRSPRYVLIMEGVGVLFLLTITQMAGAVGQTAETMSESGAMLVAISWGVLLLLVYFGLLYVTNNSQKVPRWKPTSDELSESDRAAHAESAEDDQSEHKDSGQRGYQQWSSTRLFAAFVAASAAVLAAGFVLARAGDALASQTGLGGSFVGFTLLALSTTLPEISTTVAAANSGNYSMTVSNIFGSSAFVVMLLAFVAFAAGGEVLSQAASPSTMFAGALGMTVTLVYLWGLLERQDRTVMRMGWDSAAVMVLTVAGSGVMFLLK